MPVLLHLDSSARAAPQSRSRRITQAFADAWTSLDAQHTVVRRDLHHDPLPHLADADLHFPPTLRPDDSAPPAAAVALQDELIGELLRADVVLIGAPMYNFGLPSSLKAWIDHVHVPGVTTGATPVESPLAGRTAVVAVSRGGLYDEGMPTADLDHGTAGLVHVLGQSFGMTVELVRADATLADTVPDLAPFRERSDAEIAAGVQRAADLARVLGAAD